MGTLSSCSTYQDQVGSAHIAVVSVAQWEKRQQDLKPKFNITSTGAYKLISEHTASIRESNNSSLSLGLRGAFAGFGSIPSTGTQAVNASSGQISGLDIPSIVAMDPMSAYLSATALFQEVKLLNSSVEDVVKRVGYTPYIVRMQATLMPFRRKAPYDVYMTVAFFPSSGILLPQVVPLLVTDSMETAEHYLEDNNSVQLMLSALGLFGNTKVAGDISQNWQKLRAKGGRDRNSLLTVARLTDNSIRVRFGASNQVSSKFAMIPQNHYVTILLLVPNGLVCPKNKGHIDLVAESSFVNIKNGKTLDFRKYKDVKESIKAIADKYSTSNKNCNSDNWENLLQDVIEGDYADFNVQIGTTCIYSKAIYASLLSIIVGNRATSTVFELPLPETNVKTAGSDDSCVLKNVELSSPTVSTPVLPFRFMGSVSEGLTHNPLYIPPVTYEIVYSTKNK